jgi:hypothetical protein
MARCRFFLLSVFLAVVFIGNFSDPDYQVGNPEWRFSLTYDQ